MTAFWARWPIACTACKPEGAFSLGNRGGIVAVQHISKETVMADISIKREHQLSLQQSREAAQHVAAKMAAEFDMTTQWNGDVLSFRRSGVAGTLALREKEAQIDITLDFLFKAFAATLEEKVARNMDKFFGAQAC
jgi:putative polyhydroxyalkanoate system protein